MPCASVIYPDIARTPKGGGFHPQHDRAGDPTNQSLTKFSLNFYRFQFVSGLLYAILVLTHRTSYNKKLVYDDWFTQSQPT